MKYLKLVFKEVKKSGETIYLFVKWNVFLWGGLFIVINVTSFPIDKTMESILEGKGTGWSYSKEYEKVSSTKLLDFWPDRINSNFMHGLYHKDQELSTLEIATAAGKYFANNTDLNFVMCEKEKKMFFVRPDRTSDYVKPGSGCKIQND